MRRSSKFPTAFWDSPIWQTLKGLSADHLRVYLHLVHGPHAEVSGIYRLTPGMIADDIGSDPESVSNILGELADIGWCDWEPPVVWIRGTGNVLDQLETSDLHRNERWVKATRSHLAALPPGNRLVRAFRAHHALDAEEGEEPEDKGGPVGRPIDRLCIGYRSPIDRLSEPGHGLGSQGAPGGGNPAPSRHPGDTLPPSLSAPSPLPADTQGDDSEQIRLGGVA